MEWDPKIPPWDLEELEHAVESNMGSIVGSSGSSASAGAMGSQSGGGCGRGGLDCSVDLKLGGLGDFWPSEKWNNEQPAIVKMTAPASSSSPSKRARPPGTAGQNVSCLVDGCTSDLSQGREYHRRHKVCEAHSKTAVVMVGGQEQRFCQQCSRFHLLGEFDEVKRSCRKRLDGHNRRRRKPQPELINSESFFLNQQGSRFSASYPQMLPAAMPDPNWFGIKKAEDNVLYTRQSHPSMISSQQQFPGSFCRSYGEVKQFPFLQDGDAAFTRMTMELSTCQPILKVMPSAESSSCKIFDSDCALSLLSSPSQTSVVRMSHLLPPERMPISQTSVSNLQQQYGSIGAYLSSRPSTDVSSTARFSGPAGVEDEQVGNILVSDADHLNCQVYFQIRSEGSSDGTSALPYSWH